MADPVAPAPIPQPATQAGAGDAGAAAEVTSTQAPGAAAADSTDQPMPYAEGAVFVGLLVVLAALLLTPRVIRRYQSRVEALMNSALEAPRPGRLAALGRDRAADWLVAVARQRHRAVLAVLCLAVATFALASGFAHAYTVDETRFDIFARAVSVLMFAVLAAPVVLLGMSVTRFDDHYWNWFAPVTFFALSVNIVVATLAFNEAIRGDAAVEFVHRMAWILAVLSMGAAVARWWLVRAGSERWWNRLHTRPLVVRLAIGFVACFVVGVALIAVAGSEGETTTPQDEAILAAVFFAPMLIAGFHACLGDRSGRVVFPLLALGGLAFVSAAALLAPRVDDLLAIAFPALVGESLHQSAWYRGFTGLAGVAAAAGLAYAMLTWVGLAYKRKVFSDSQFQVFAWMLTIAGMVAFLEAARQGGDDLFNGASLGVGLAAVLALALYVGLIRLMRSPPVRIRLLLLRVFAHDKRGENLLDELAYRWRYVGPIVMIGGPDMARATIDAGEASDFLLGRFDDDFIYDADILESRIVNIDDQADPDGRFRINEFFCRTDMWQQAVTRLMVLSDTILLDLRGFNAGRGGTAFEIGALARGGLLPRTVVLTDATTDDAAVSAAMAQGLAGAAGGQAPLQATPRTIDTGADFNGDALFRALVEVAVSVGCGRPEPRKTLGSDAAPVDA